MVAKRDGAGKPSNALRGVLVPLALAQFICSFAGSNMNVMINDISEDLNTTVQGVQTAITNKKTVMTTCTPWTVVFRSVLMSVIITFMFEPAKLQMNCANASGTRTRRKAADGRPVSAV